jgi:hypothetical protein
MRWFKQIVKYKVVELEKPAPRLTSEDASNIASLANHPGFHALLGRLKAQKGVLEAALRTQRHESLNEVYSLQAGINWINWLDKQVQIQAGKPTTTARDAFEQEAIEFQRMAEALEFVGKG